MKDLTERLNRARDLHQPAWPQLETDQLIDTPATHAPSMGLDSSKVDLESEDQYQDTVESQKEKPKLVLNTSESEPDIHDQK